MKSHDIDFYYRGHDKCFHLMSYGNLIPKILNDKIKNRKVQQKIARLITENNEVQNLDVIVNYLYVNRILELIKEWENNEDFQINIKVEDIVSYFVENTKLGFYSFDFLKNDDDGNDIYQLVSKPKNDVDMQNWQFLPEYLEYEYSEKEEILKIKVK